MIELQENNTYVHRPTGTVFNDINDLNDKIANINEDMSEKEVSKLMYALTDLEAQLALDSISDDMNMYWS